MRIGIKKIFGKSIKPGIVIIITLALLGLIPIANALTIPSEQVVFIDGTGDQDSTVRIIAVELMNFDIDFGYMSGDTFTALPFSYTFHGGDIIDFAIRESVGGQTVVTTASSGAARMDFFGVVPAVRSENPEVSFDYWKGVNIFWQGAWADELLVSVRSAYDGLAPAHSTGYNPGHSVPDANIMFLLGPALLILGIIGRKKTKV